MGEKEMRCLHSGAPGESGRTRDEVWARGKDCQLTKSLLEFVLVARVVPELAPILLLDGE